MTKRQAGKEVLPTGNAGVAKKDIKNKKCTLQQKCALLRSLFFLRIIIIKRSFGKKKKYPKNLLAFFQQYYSIVSKTIQDTTAMKKAGLYLRVSTAQQVLGDSLETQEKILRKYSQDHEYEIFKIYREEGQSAKDMQRPELEKLKQDIAHGNLDAVLVIRLDRITRSNRDLWKLIEFFGQHNVDFVSTTENFDTQGPTGRFMLNMLASLAQMEREITARRVSEAMYSRAEDGKWNGGVIPYGYTTQARIAAELHRKGMQKEDALFKAAKAAPEMKKLYLDEEEARILKKIFEHYLKTRSVRNTVQWLNENNYRTRRGELWASSTIHRLLSSPTYNRQIVYGKRTTDINSGKLRKNNPSHIKIKNGPQPDIIPQDIFAKAQQVLSETTLKPTRAPRTYLLSGAGILRCGICRGPMFGYTYIKPGADKEYFYYKCNRHLSMGNKACAGLVLNGRDLEDFVVNALKGLEKNTKFLSDKKEMLEVLKLKTKTLKQDKGDDIKRIRQEQANLQARLDTLLDKLETRVIDDDTFRQRHEALKRKIEENKMAELEAGSKAEHAEVEEAGLRASFEQIVSFENNWNSLDDIGRACLIRTIVKQIRATHEKVEMDIFLDLVDNLSCKGKDSSPPPA
ncbi:MAG: recombinase family protein [Verrucomicrobia bacterium]|nr:recombinase family protein [Verrucomicrobiota bacterium]MBU1736151.1 recombinase family protein [Verrucomicrobiota bacterium]